MLPFRGLIDWHFDFIYTLKFEWQDEFTYYDVPIMHPDHAFAINREFFFEVGGYDEGMTLEGGENIDLSFKMWHCAGGIFEIPCSKIALMIDFINPPIKDHVYRNYKRIAEIWMDNHKEFFYARDPERYAKIDAGDVSKQLKARSICSPFNYFLEFVADDLLKRYPLRIDHPKFASGTIKSLGNLNLCLDSFVKPLGLATCDKNSTNPRIGQNFIFSYNKNILLSHVDFCLDAVQMDISLCMYNGYSGQLWTYTLIDMQLKAYKDSAEYCLTANSANSLFMATCNNTNPFQKWEFGTVQIDALNNFNEINEYNLDLLDLSYEKTFENVIL